MGYDIAEIDELLGYASVLVKQGLPIIYDQEHFSKLLGLKLSYIIAMANSNRKFYKTFEIPKHNGSKRLIEQPLVDLLIIQRWILDYILIPASYTYVHHSAKAFMSGMSLTYNLAPHVKKDIVVALDIKDFFTNITFWPVYNIFHEMGYNNKISKLLAQLCLYKGFLPQGAPTSPMLSNLIFYRMDTAISGYCERRNITYTRYADDLVFSGKKIQVKLLVRYVEGRLAKNSLFLNTEKTKVMGRGNAQYVTGCVVNDKMNVPRQYRKKIRQEVFHLMTKGLSVHFSKVKGLPSHIKTPESYLNHLLGKIYYVLQINAEDMEFLKYRDEISQLIQSVHGEL